MFAKKRGRLLAKFLDNTKYILSRNQSLVDNAPAIVIGFDRKMVVTSWNPKAEKLFSIPLSAAMGRKLIDILSTPSQFNQDLANIKKVLDGGTISENEAIRKSLTNEYMILKETIFPVKDADGKVTGGVIFAMDHTKLSHVGKLLDCTQQVAKVGVWTLDLINNHFFASEYTLETLGVNKEVCHDFISFSNCLVPEDRKSFRDAVSQSKMDLKGTSFESIAQNGTHLKIRWLVETLGAEPIRILGVIKDHTEEQERLAELEEKSKSLILKNKMSALGEMSSGLAHEINSPLLIISGSAQILEGLIESDRLTTKHLTDNIKRIAHASDRVTKIISSLKSFSRNASEDPLVPVKISDIIKETTIFCESKIADANITLYVPKVADDLVVRCRKAEISQVLLNLILNAFDARKYQTAHDSWIRVEVSQDDEQTHISVTDNGSGIPEKVRKKIMMPFFTTKEVGKGTGLGLSMSKGIVENHHGKLWLDQSDGNTRFVISLPRVNAKTEQSTKEDKKSA